MYMYIHVVVAAKHIPCLRPAAINIADSRAMSKIDVEFLTLHVNHILALVKSLCRIHVPLGSPERLTLANMRSRKDRRLCMVKVTLSFADGSLQVRLLRVAGQRIEVRCTSACSSVGFRA